MQNGVAISRRDLSEDEARSSAAATFRWLFRRHSVSRNGASIVPTSANAKVEERMLTAEWSSRRPATQQL
jgi:hypothetical protein